MRRAYYNQLTKSKSIKTIEQIKSVCRLLQDTNYPFHTICEIAGIKNLSEAQSKGLCSDIVQRKYWKDISKDFDFTKRIENRNMQISITTKESIWKDICISSIEYAYKNFYGKEWKFATRKERDNFRHIVNRIIKKHKSL